MSDRMHRVGAWILGDDEGFLRGVVLTHGWQGLLGLAIWVPIIGMTIGALFISADRTGPALPSDATYVWQMSALVAMFVSVWASRMQSRAVSLAATAVFFLAGLSFTALEARTGAAFDLGV